MAIPHFLKTKKLLFLVIFLILGAAHLFYPKWQNSGSESIISWDVYGYYLYLPAFFIYDDLEKLSFVETINQQYHLVGENFELTKLPNGNATGQYSLGWAFFHSPAFALGHLAALLSNHPTDGFSIPYQIALNLYGIAIAYLGILLSFFNLRNYFSFNVSALSVLFLLLGTNALNYFAIDSAHTHGPLFFLYALLIFTTISWHKRPSLIKSILIGIVGGLMCTMRPTEILALLIPLFWGIGNWQGLLKRARFFKSNGLMFAGSILSFLLFPAIQLWYWKIVTGQLLFYSYAGQTFSWLHPHIFDVLFSYRKGWLLYTPFALLFLIGFPFLFKKSPKLFYCISIFFLLNFYIVSAWDIWWYGGSLGQRALVQSYALLLFPLSALLQEAFKAYWSKIILGIFCIGAIAHNLMFHYKAHSSAPFEAEAMTAAFFKRTYFEFKPNPEFYKLLDTDFIFEGEIDTSHLYNFSEEKLVLSPNLKTSNYYIIKLIENQPYFRLLFNAKSPKIAGYFWNMPQINIHQIAEGNNQVQTNFLRVHRFLKPEEVEALYFDIELNPKTTQLAISLSNPNGEESLEVVLINGISYNSKLSIN